MDRAEHIINEILDKIIAARKKHGHTQNMVADKIGFSQAMYSQVESGNRKSTRLCNDYFLSIGISQIDIFILNHKLHFHCFIAGLERGLKGEEVDNHVVKQLFYDFASDSDLKALGVDLQQKV